MQRQYQDIVTLYEYNYWATQRTLAASASLAYAQYGAPVVSNPGYGSLRSILVHMLDTERGWRMLCQHQRPPTDLREADVPTHAHLVQIASFLLVCCDSLCSIQPALMQRARLACSRVRESRISE